MKSKSAHCRYIGCERLILCRPGTHSSYTDTLLLPWWAEFWGAQLALRVPSRYLVLEGKCRGSHAQQRPSPFLRKQRRSSTSLLESSHNPKVGGSNPPRATNKIKHLA